MQSSVSNRQIFFLLLLTMTAYTVISVPKVIAQGAGTGGWLSLMITSLLFAVSAVVIVRLNSAFPGMMLFEYSQRIVGRIMAYALAFYYILYFFVISAYLNVQLTAVLRVGFYPKTPEWAMTIVSVIVFGIVAHRGVVSVARFFEVIGTIFVITGIVTHFVMLLQGDLREVQPFFRASKIPEYLLGVKDCLFAFLGVELLTIFPLSGKSIGRSIATAFLTVLFIGVFYVFVVETCIMMLGMQSAQNYNFALIEAIKQIDNPVLERFDILFLTVGFAGLVAGVCGIYLALVEYAVRLFKKVNRLLIVVGVGAIIVALSIATQAVKPVMAAFESVLPITGLASAFLIPVILFLIAKVGGLAQKPL
ncbi:MAG: endospore germination permease [Christensenellaceae bacterium]|nr:endospore germination permease [Christensenellaceae bacterium]